MRIDVYLAQKFGSRTKAATAVNKGLVLVNGKKVTRSYEVKDGDAVEIIEAEENFVSAGGFKLAKALKDFDFCVKDKIFADIGASTGGFTDCLLQNDAKKVYCIDARNLNGDLFEEALDGAVIDVSFISLTYVLGAVANTLENGKNVLALIKPQFECESRSVGKNGIVRDDKIKAKIIEKIYNFALSVDLAPKKLTVAPIVKGKNIEFVILLEKGGAPEPLTKLKKSVGL